MSHGISRIIHTSKMMFSWLPVGHSWYKCNLGTDVCPYCRANDKIFEHLLLCKHDNLEEVWRAAYLTVQRTCNKAKLTNQFTMMFLKIVWSVLGTIETPTFDDLSAPMSPVIIFSKI